jgi:chromosome segregation ATPase
MTTEFTPSANDGEGYTAPAVLAARRAPRISQADVFQAADELLVQGDRPTIDRVRMRLGRGSPNTINDHLDTWWTKLGSRLRDLPGREFPQLPERVAHSLQRLWNEALEAAHETLQGTLLEREQVILEREQSLESQTRHLDELEQVAATRAVALQESLTLAREQLLAANSRAEHLEGALQERHVETARLRIRIEVLEASSTDLRGKLDAVTSAHQAERIKLEERYAAAEARWLVEVDRARQTAKDLAREHERQVKELRGRISPLQIERDHIRREFQDARAELKRTAAVREQLEEHLRALANPSSEVPRTARSKAKRTRKTTRTTREAP